MEQAKEASSASGGEEDSPRPIFSDAQMRKLRFAVVGMGVILLLGFGLVIGRIVYLVNQSPVAANANPPASAMQALPPEAKLSLPAGAVVRNVSLAGNRLAVHFDSPAGGGIAIVDLTTGLTVQRLDITTAPRP